MKLSFIIVLILPCIVSWNIVRPFLHHRMLHRRHCLETDGTPEGSSNDGNPTVGTAGIDMNATQLKDKAMELLDCLTSTKDENDPDYDFEKDMRRNDLLMANDYMDLKIALRAKGLKTSGDKLEMIARLLLNQIDPSIKYDELSGMETKLEYINASDLSEKKVRVRTSEERSADSIYNLTPDADDMGVLKSRRWNDDNAKLRQVMDGLVRKVVNFAPVRVSRSEEQARKDDFFQILGSKSQIQRENVAYLVVGKQVQKDWQNSSPAVILLPSKGDNWCDKTLRVIADEIAFATQSLVIIPDIYREEEEAPGNNRSRSGNNRSRSNENQEEKFRKRILDDVVAAMHYMRVERGARVVSLMGVGTGAGYALEIACDLQDMGRAAQCERANDLLLPKLSHQVRSSVVEGQDKYAHFPYSNVRKALIDGDESARKILEQVSEEFNSVFLQPIVASEGDDTPLSETIGNAHDGVEGSREEKEERTMEIEEKEVTRKDMDDFLKTVDAANLSSASSASLDSLEQHSSTDRNKRYHEEWTTALVSAERSYSRKILAPFATFNLQEMKNFVPRSVCALDPQRFDVRRIGSELSIPVFIATSSSSVDGDNDEQGKKESIAERLSSLFSFRKNEIVDFCIREYENIKRSFTAPPIIENHDRDEMEQERYKDSENNRNDEQEKEYSYEVKCSQEVVDIASLWLEAFSGATAEGMIQGAGSAKFEEEAYVRVKENDMNRSIRRSVVAAYLHDDTDSFAN